MKRKYSSLALMFLSMGLTLQLTDQVVRSAQEVVPGPHTQVAEHCSPYVDVWSLPEAGLGTFIECEPSGIRLVTCLPGHAADKAGLRVGDRIVAINGENTRGANEAWAIQQLRGKIGTRVTLDVERGDGLWQRTFRTQVERANIESEYSVYSRLKDSELVVKVFWLGPETAEQLANHLSQISDSSVDRVVLDLTNLSKGDFRSLQECASLFLPEGSVVGHYSVLKSDGTQEMTPLTTTGHPFTDRLTTVKVGAYTARQGEMLARALVDQLHVSVEGEATAGLGTLDCRTIKSRGQSAVNGSMMYDSHGEAIDGHPLRPGFWTWSSLMAPVSSGIE